MNFLICGSCSPVVPVEGRVDSCYWVRCVTLHAFNFRHSNKKALFSRISIRNVPKPIVVMYHCQLNQSNSHCQLVHPSFDFNDGIESIAQQVTSLALASAWNLTTTMLLLTAHYLFDSWCEFDSIYNDTSTSSSLLWQSSFKCKLDSWYLSPKYRRDPWALISSKIHCTSAFICLLESLERPSHCCGLLSHLKSLKVELETETLLRKMLKRIIAKRRTGMNQLDIVNIL